MATLLWERILDLIGKTNNNRLYSEKIWLIFSVFLFAVDYLFKIRFTFIYRMNHVHRRMNIKGGDDKMQNVSYLKSQDLQVTHTLQKITFSTKYALWLEERTLKSWNKQ